MNSIKLPQKRKMNSCDSATINKLKRSQRGAINAPLLAPRVSTHAEYYGSIQKQQSEKNKMKIVITPIGSWLDAVNAARATVRAKPLTKEPSEHLRRELLDAEHSPIRLVTFKIEMIGIPYWVSVHLVRHKIGVEHFVSTQRTDRTGTKRDDLPQGSLVNHTMIANAQALINISHRRLCNTASPETHKVWQAVVNKLKTVDPIVADFCVPMCVYRGGICHEHYSPCGRFPVMALNQTIKEN